MNLYYIHSYNIFYQLLKDIQVIMNKIVKVLLFFSIILHVIINFSCLANKNLKYLIIKIL